MGHPQSNRTYPCHSLICIYFFVFVEKKYLSSANTALVIIIRISSAINSYPSSGSIELPHNYVKLISLSWPFSMKDGSKLNESELAPKGSTNQKKCQHTSKADYVGYSLQESGVHTLDSCGTDTMCACPRH